MGCAPPPADGAGQAALPSSGPTTHVLLLPAPLPLPPPLPAGWRLARLGTAAARSISRPLPSETGRLGPLPASAAAASASASAAAAAPLTAVAPEGAASLLLVSMGRAVASAAAVAAAAARVVWGRVAGGPLTADGRDGPGA